MIRSFLWAYNRPLGINPANVLTMRFDLPDGKYPRAADQLAFHRQLIERIRALPGVQSAAIGSSLPTSGSSGVDYESEDAPADHKKASTSLTLVGDQYFETLETAPVSGRVLIAADQTGSGSVAVINRTLAEQAWPGKDAVGKRMRVVKGSGPGPWVTVVGVVPELVPSSQRTAEPMLYQPYRQDLPPRASPR